jgi:SAM-dependent methyltransferase
MNESLARNKIETPSNLTDSHAEDSNAIPFLDDAAEIVTGEKLEQISSEVQRRFVIGIEGDYFNKTHYGEKNEAISDYFKGIFNQANVLDLGCGVQGAGYKIANFSNAKRYVGVEKNFGKTAFEAIASRAKNNTPFEIIQDDMFHYLTSSEENFDLILLVGIDSSIVPTDKLREVIKMINQKLNENGKLLTSGAIKDLAEAKKIFEIDPDYKRVIQENTSKLSLKNKDGQRIEGKPMLPIVWRKLKT